MTKKPKRRSPTTKPSSLYFKGFTVAKVTAILILVGLMFTGYFTAENWMRVYHSAFAIAGNVEQQIEGLKALYVQSKDLQIQTQINGLRTEKRILSRQVNDLRFKRKKVVSTDNREAITHIIDDLKSQMSDLDLEIKGLHARQTKEAQ